MAKKFYITTAIPYVNSAPHTGFALEIIQADVIARYHRLLEEDVRFLTGTDENALKNVQAAEKEGIVPQALVDKYSAKFKALKEALSLSFDDFIRTTEKRHISGAQKFWQACQKDIYKKKYRGFYCVGCEEFKTAKDLVKSECPEHPGRKLELIEEKNYFFKLSAYQKQIEELIASDKLKIFPQTRKNEILSFVRSGLQDFSISRSVERAKNWGIPVPGNPEQIIYVWFDALINYITALGYVENGDLFKKYWLENDNILHCIGKGIIRFHVVYWPAMLLSAGLPLPTQELVHGYLTVEGQKISKSLGNVVDPFVLVAKYGSDAIRYYLLKTTPLENDLDFSSKHFEEVYNADLANGIGNLISRVLTLALKYCDGKVPVIEKDPEQHPLRVSKKIYTWKDAYRERDKALEKYKFNEALEAIWKFIGTADKYVNDTKPWELALKDKEKFNFVIYGLLDSLHQLAWMIYPFLPGTSFRIAQILQIKGLLISKPNDKNSWTNIKSGTKINNVKALFPRIV